MISISLCMIVKNEEKVLKRCLDSIADLMDEIIIIDTGSTDRTKEIASEYTELIYDYTWTGNFAAARNFSFSKATMDYIYCADADEILDEANRQKFRMLKKGLLEEIDIVQMYYCNQLEFNTVYNFDKEYRPKLFKRLRTFQWINPIHETVRLEPVIYDSDIEIIHKPTSVHASRDLATFLKMYKDGIPLSKHLHTMYAKELMIAGEKEDFENAIPYFEQALNNADFEQDSHLESYCVLAKAYRITGQIPKFFKYTTKAVTGQDEGCSEICFELGNHYWDTADYEEAIIWYYACVNSTQPILFLQCQKDAMYQLSLCYMKLGQDELSSEYYKQYKEMK